MKNMEFYDVTDDPFQHYRERIFELLASTTIPDFPMRKSPFDHIAPFLRSVEAPYYDSQKNAEINGIFQNFVQSNCCQKTNDLESWKLAANLWKILEGSMAGPKLFTLASLGSELPAFVDFVEWLGSNAAGNHDALAIRDNLVKQISEWSDMPDGQQWVDMLQSTLQNHLNGSLFLKKENRSFLEKYFD